MSMYSLGFAATEAVEQYRQKFDPRGSEGWECDSPRALRDTLQQFIYLSAAADRRGFHGTWEAHMKAIRAEVSRQDDVKAAKRLLRELGYEVSVDPVR